MDEHTLQILGFDKLRQLVAGYAPSPLGRERVLDLVPGLDREVLQVAQCLVAEMVQAIEQGTGVAFGEIRDIRPHVRRARAEAMLSAENLRETSATLFGLKRLRDSFARLASTCPRLAQQALLIHDLSGLAYDIEARIDDRSRVMDSASRELARLRAEIEKLDERIRALMQRLLRLESIKRVLSYPNYTVTGAHYVLPVAKDHRHEVPGIVHRTSASGDTLFIEPTEVAEMAAEMALLRSHEQREVNRILRQLSGDVGRFSSITMDSLTQAAELCCVYAKARFAREYCMVQPKFSDDARLDVHDARHPLLEHLFRHESAAAPVAPAAEPGAAADTATAAARATAPGTADLQLREIDATDDRAASQTAVGRERTVVPITVHLGSRFDVLVVTGPNTGGKTVALKTVGLLAVMAQAGLHIPAAAGSTLPIFDEVLADIGDEQSIEQSLSTFSSHVSRIASILQSATRQSLVLLDELGAGTDPAEGAALGRAILDRLLDMGVKALVTTHLGDLKLYALGHPRAENAAVEFDVETLRPTYHLRIGDTGQSSALVIARRLELPAGIVDRAEQYLATSRTGRPQEIEILQERRAEAEAARTQAWQAEQQAQRSKEAFETRLRELDRQAADALALEEFRATLQPGDTAYVRKFRRAGTVKRVDHKRRTATVSHGSMHWELSIDELEPVRSEV